MSFLCSGCSSDMCEVKYFALSELSSLKKTSAGEVSEDLPILMEIGMFLCRTVRDVATSPEYDKMCYRRSFTYII